LGKGHHDFLEALKGAVREAEVERFGMVGHIDMLEDYPIEIKTTRQPIEAKNVPSHYLRQLAYYCVLTGSEKGFLVVFHLISGSLQVFEVDYSNYWRSALNTFATWRERRFSESVSDTDISAFSTVFGMVFLDVGWVYPFKLSFWEA
jgi:hypothetical protein